MSEKIRNPKFEARNNIETRKTKTAGVPVSSFAVSDLFRISSFELRHSG